MTRVEVVAEVNARLSEVLAEAGIAAVDSAGQLKEPIDDALQAMGVTRADRATAAPTDGDRFVAQVEYQALRRVVRKLHNRFGLTLDSGDSYRLDQIYAHAKELLAEAGARLTGRYGFSVGVLGLGWVAPVEAADEYAAADA